MQQIEQLLDESAQTLRIQPDNLPSSVQRFFTEWKERGKEVERLRARLVDLELQNVRYDSVKGVNLVIKEIDVDPSQLASLARKLSKNDGVALLASSTDTLHLVLSSGSRAVDAGKILGQITLLIDGKGGGNATMAHGVSQDRSQLEPALQAGKKLILSALGA